MPEAESVAFPGAVMTPTINRMEPRLWPCRAWIQVHPGHACLIWCTQVAILGGQNPSLPPCQCDLWPMCAAFPCPAD